MLPCSVIRPGVTKECTLKDGNNETGSKAALAGATQVVRKFGMAAVPHPFLAAAVTATSSFVVSVLTLWYVEKSQETWKMHGTGGDAKGQPTQTNSISHGSPHIRIKKIMVGAAYA